jgi:hypothetical protein
MEIDAALTGVGGDAAIPVADCARCGNRRPSRARPHCPLHDATAPALWRVLSAAGGPRMVVYQVQDVRTGKARLVGHYERTQQPPHSGTVGKER